MSRWNVFPCSLCVVWSESFPAITSKGKIRNLFSSDSVKESFFAITVFTVGTLSSRTRPISFLYSKCGFLRFTESKLWDFLRIFKFWDSTKFMRLWNFETFQKSRKFWDLWELWNLKILRLFKNYEIFEIFRLTEIERGWFRVKGRFRVKSQKCRFRVKGRFRV